jgi:hypothetical protein
MEKAQKIRDSPYREGYGALSIESRPQTNTIGTKDGTFGDPIPDLAPNEYKESRLDMDHVAKLSGRMINNRFPKIKYDLLKHDKSFHNNLKSTTA